jgi:hypothetical protein
MASEKAKIRVGAGMSPSGTFAAAVAGVGYVGEVVSENDLTSEMREEDFKKLCEGATIAVAELAVLLQFWKVDLSTILSMFLDALEDEQSQPDSPKPGPGLRLVKHGEEN